MMFSNKFKYSSILMLLGSYSQSLAQPVQIKSFTNVQSNDLQRNIEARSEKSNQLIGASNSSLNELGVQLILQGNKEQGLQHLELAHQNDPKNCTVLYNLSGYYLGEKNYESALASINEALSIAPEDLHFLKRKADILLSLKKFEDTAQVYQRIIRIEPNHAESYSKLGAIYGLLGKWQESEINLILARRLVGDDPSILNNLASARLMQKKYHEAIEVLEIAQQKWPTADREITLGVAYEGLGENDKAVAHYVRAKQLGTTNDHLEAHIQRVSQ